MRVIIMFESGFVTFFLFDNFFYFLTVFRIWGDSRENISPLQRAAPLVWFIQGLFPFLSFISFRSTWFPFCENGKTPECFLSRPLRLCIRASKNCPNCTASSEIPQKSCSVWLIDTMPCVPKWNKSLILHDKDTAILFVRFSSLKIQPFQKSHFTKAYLHFFC